MLAKNCKQTETGKKQFIRLLELAIIEEDHKLRDFCEDILDVDQRHDMNSHIRWNAEKENEKK